MSGRVAFLRSLHPLRTLVVVLAAALAALAVALSAPAAADADVTFSVDSTDDAPFEDGVADCTVDTLPCTLRAAVEQANDQDAGNHVHIDVPAGTYLLIDGQLSAELDGTVTIEGAGQDDTIIDADGNSRHLYVDDDTDLTVRELTFTNGTPEDDDDDGGSVYVDGHMTVEDTTFDGNQAHEDGGAIYNDGDEGLVVSGATFVDNASLDESGGAIAHSSASLLEISDSHFEGNAAGDRSGALDMHSGASLDVTRSTFVDNVAADDGGVLRIGSGGSDNAITITDSHFAENHALDGDGGVFRLTATDLTLTDSVFTGNSASDNGGVVGVGGSGPMALTIEGSTLADNSAGDAGGAVQTTTADVVVDRSTISGNTAGEDGGAIRVSNADGTLKVTGSTLAVNAVDVGAHQISSIGAVTLERSIVVSDGSDPACEAEGDGSFTSDGFNLGSDDSCGLDAGEDDLIGEAPLLGPLADNGGPTPTMALDPASPARDAAGDDCEDVDQRGVSRPQGAACDIGAFELGTGEISGMVTNAATGASVHAATITLDGPDSASTTTEAGAFSIDDLAEGDFTVSIEATGYQPADLTATLTALEPTMLDIELTPNVACPDGDVPAAGFSDVPSDSVHAGPIDCLAWYDVARGRTDTTYDPAGTVTRAQQASFVARMLTAAGHELPDVDGDAFGDIAGSTHAEAISQLAELGVVEGRGGGIFDPSGEVTRAQSASMIVRAANRVLDEPLSAPAGPFTDTAGSVHEANIDAAAAAGITQGRTATTFEPGADTRRDQMASLLARTLEVLATGGHVTHP